MVEVKAATRDPVFAAFATPAMFEAPGYLPIMIDVIGPDRRLIEVPTSGEFVLSERQHVITFRRDQAPEMPQGSEITVNGILWVVDSVPIDDSYLAQAIVIRKTL